MVRPYHSAKRAHNILGHARLPSHHTCERSFPKLTLRRRLSSGDRVCFPPASTEILWMIYSCHSRSLLVFEQPTRAHTAFLRGLGPPDRGPAGPAPTALDSDSLGNGYQESDFILVQLFVWRLIKHWSINPKSSVHANNVISFPIYVHRGVRQGSVLSPVLFLLVMDPILLELQQKSYGLSVKGLFFQCSVQC